MVLHAAGAAAYLPVADPTPAPGSLLVEPVRPCYQIDNGSLCRRVFDWTDNAWIANSSDWLVAKPLRIVTIFLIAVLLRRILRRAIDRLCERAASGSVPGVLTR